ncbi:MAG: HDOD domain-containing protein [Opitutaceae bacterium]|jgi:HD-like signal output (HDOD) protein
MGNVSASLPLHVCSSPDELVRQLRTLPPVPKVLARLQPMLADLNTDLNDLASVIRMERALAARVLQVSNSAFVGLGSRTRSIEEAIGRLGFREVRRLVTIVIGLQILERPLPVYGIDSRSLWKQSIACGLAAEEVAKIVDEDSNAAYSLGLLHSVGMVVVNAWAAMVAKDTRLITTGYPDEYTESERTLLGFTNADTGAALLRRWDFPPAVVEPVRAQYQPVLAASHSRLAHLLLVARWLRSAACDADLPGALPDSRSMAILGFSEVTLTETLVIVRRRLEDAGKLLNIN